MTEVVIYTTPTCHFCEEAKKLLNSLAIPFKTVDVQSDHKARMHMIEISKSMGVPVIEIDGKVIVGADKLESYLSERLYGRNKVS